MGIAVCGAVGASTYLAAWLDEHAEVRWIGCSAPEVRAARSGCPEINGLGVWPEDLRSRVSAAR